MKKSLLLGLCALGTIGTLNAQMTEDFEGTAGTALPTGWASSSAGGSTSPGFQSGTSAASSQYFDLTSNNTRFAYVNDDDCNCDMSDEQLTTASFSLPAGQAYFMSFDYSVRAFYGETAELEISTDGGSTFSALASLDPVADWTSTVVSLAAYAGQNNLVLKFKYNDNADWGSGLAIDNIDMYIPANDNAMLAGIDFVKAPGENIDVVVTNMGGNDLTAFDIDYNLNGTAGTMNVSQTITPGNTATITITGVTIPEAAGQDLTVDLTNINGGTDSDPSDNSGSVMNFNADILVAATVPNFTLADKDGNTHDLHTVLSTGHYVVLDFMASWCGPCASSTPELNTMYVNNSPSMITYAITVEENDDNAVMANLGWGGTYPKIAHSKMNDDLYSYYNGLFGSGGIPLFIGICPNPSDPGNSTVDYDQVGWSSGVFGPLQTAFDNCGTVSIDENVLVQDIKVYPNPVNDKATVAFNVNKADLTSIQIISTSGQVVKTMNLGNIGGAMQLDVDFSDIEAGIYILSINVGGSVNTQKITVTK